MTANSILQRSSSQPATSTKIVYTTQATAWDLNARLGAVATIVDLGDSVTAEALLDDLANRGVERLMVEGGGSIHTLFLSSGVVDELHLVFAPFFVGDAAAPRFVNSADFPQDPNHRMQLVETRQIGDCVLLRYLPQWS